MGGSLATLVFTIGILGLFYLNRDKSIRTSPALWIPVIWLWLAGSRPLSFWLGVQSPGDVSMEGSPFDRVFFSVLIAFGLIVLIHRGRPVLAILRNNWAICLYFSYSLISFVWSDFPDISFKRWTKAIGDLVMVLVVVTDAQPVPAIKRLLSRAGFVLLPACVLVDKYFGNISRSYDPFTGRPTITGVTTDKNSLGVIVYILTLGAFWQITEILRSKELSKRDRRRHFLAQVVLAAFGITVLISSNSATSLTCLVVSAGLMVATAHPIFKRKGVAHVFVLGLIAVGALAMLVVGRGDIMQALGRSDTLSGRTDLWQRLIPLAPNPLVGAGFETFWMGPRLNALRGVFWFTPNEAHDGYIEVYLQLGWIGVGLIALIFLTGYQKAVTALRGGNTVASLALGYIIAALLYNVTEAGFRMLNPSWIFLLLMIMSASAVTLAQRNAAEQPFVPPDPPWRAVADRKMPAPVLARR